MLYKRNAQTHVSKLHESQVDNILIVKTHVKGMYLIHDCSISLDPTLQQVTTRTSKSAPSHSTPLKFMPKHTFS
jgi:hypothetical protein